MRTTGSCIECHTSATVFVCLFVFMGHVSIEASCERLKKEDRSIFDSVASSDSMQAKHQADPTCDRDTDMPLRG